MMRHWKTSKVNRLLLGLHVFLLLRNVIIIHVQAFLLSYIFCSFVLYETKD